MTKYILHGGMVKYENDLNASFFKELTKDLVEGDTVLHIGFARDAGEERQKIFERDRNLILASTESEPSVVSATPEEVEFQLDSAKAVFVTGGDTEALISDMRAIENFSQLLEGKTYAGSSAGAYVVSRYYFSGAKGIQQGLDLLPIRIAAHYGDPAYDPDGKAAELLQALSDDTELILLKECEWTVREG